MVAKYLSVAVGLVLVTLGPIAPIAPAVEAATGEVQAAPTNVIEVDPWLLLQSDGPELYGHLCSSCHGTVATGRAEMLELVPTFAPRLTQLRASGVPEEHWTYVINCPCEDPHHRASDGTELMPCWRMVFREALNSEAAPMLVSVRLKDYLLSIQE